MDSDTALPSSQTLPCKNILISFRRLWIFGIHLLEEAHGIIALNRFKNRNGKSYMLEYTDPSSTMDFTGAPMDAGFLMNYTVRWHFRETLSNTVKYRQKLLQIFFFSSSPPISRNPRTYSPHNRNHRPTRMYLFRRL
jgi:hypothetical protein